MTTRESLHKYRESTLGEEAHVRVFFFHAHIYYDPDGPQKEKMLALHKKLQDDFKDDPNVEVHTLQEGAVGPHPTANLEVLFTRNRFTYMLSYMTFHVAPTFSTLIHELTADQLGDHTTRAIWLGEQLQVKPELLRKMDKQSAERGLSEEEIIWAVHSH